MSKAFKGLKKVASVALPVAAAFIPGIGPLASAALGAAGGALGGGGLKGALLGGLGGAFGGGALSGLGGQIGGALNSIGLGGLTNALSGIGSGISNLLSPLDAIGSSMRGGLGELLSNTPLSSILSSGRTGLSTSATDALPWLKNSAGKITSSSAQLPWNMTASANDIISGGAQRGILEQLMNSISNPSLNDVTTLAGLFQALNPSTPKGMMSQQEILNRMQSEQEQQRQQNTKFMEALNSSPLQRTQVRPDVDYYRYGESGGEKLFYDNPLGNPRAFKSGGSVDKLKGQADTVHAKLSVGEYVIPADVVSHLGDGNTDAGAKALDMMLENVRKHKAPALAKGVLPPVAKSPLAYVGAN